MLTEYTFFHHSIAPDALVIGVLVKGAVRWGTPYLLGYLCARGRTPGDKLLRAPVDCMGRLIELIEADNAVFGFFLEYKYNVIL